MSHLVDLAIYEKARAGEAVIVPLPARAHWRLSGPDRVRYLNGQITQDVVSLPMGQCLHAAVCTAKGRMEGELMVAAAPDALWIDAPGALRESLGRRLEKYLIADDAELADVAGDWGIIHILGSVPPPASQPAMDFASRRFGWPGTDRWVLRSALPRPDLGAEAVAETLRLEHGLAVWGRELDEKTLPPEAGLDRYAISYTKGCYVGQETIARIKSIGHPNRHLCVLVSEDDNAPAPGTPLRELGTNPTAGIGLVTSAGWSPSLKKGIALGFVHRQHALVGHKLAAGEGVVTIVDPPLVS